MIKTAVFSGSFNPIHIGHLVLANYLCEFTDVEEVWLMVSPLNPLKEPDVVVDSHVSDRGYCSRLVEYLADRETLFRLVVFAGCLPYLAVGRRAVYIL